MARQVLDNGIVLPSEYSDDWYDDMTSNLTKLDEVIGSDAEKLSASDVGAAAISNDYDDLDDKPTYNILRRASVTLTAGGTGNYTDLDSDSKIKAGDYVLDAANKLYSITAIDAANSTYTVSAAALINITDKSELGAAALSNSYDDLDDKPAYNILRRASVTLTAGGTGNYTDLDSDSKIKAGDYVLDAANKLYSITAIDAANSTYTVSAAALINITDKSELGAAALSNSYDDLSNLPGYGILRFCSTAITDNSSVAFANISSVSKIAAGDFLLDTAAKLYTVSAVDTSNETVSVTTPLTQLAVDANVMHLSGNETAAGKKTFSEYITSDGSVAGDEYTSNTKTNLWLMGNRDTEDVSGVLFDTYRQNTAQGTAVHILGIGIKENSVRYEGCRWGWYWDNNLNGYIFEFKPTTQGTNQAVKHSLGTSTDKWDTINGINPGALSFPDLSAGLDISGYISAGDSDNSYTPLADGYISVRVNSTNSCALYASQGDVYISSYGNIVDVDLGGFICSLFIPVVKNVACRIVCRRAQTIVSAKFFPCQGNV